MRLTAEVVAGADGHFCLLVLVGAKEVARSKTYFNDEKMRRDLICRASMINDANLCELEEPKMQTERADASKRTA